MKDGKLLKKKDMQKLGFEEEKTQWEKLRADTVNSIFGVFYILLKTQTDSRALWKYTLLLLIQFL